MMSTSTPVTSAPTASTAVLIIGGAVVDMVYQSTNASATASSMFATSTPCRLARVSCGGVGRNIGEALGRLFAATPPATCLTDADECKKQECPLERVELRTVVGGTSSYRNGTNDVVEVTMPDNNGSMLLRELDRVVSECASSNRSGANEVNGPHLGVGSGHSLGAASVSNSSAFSYSCCVVKGEQTASYVATLDSRGELVSAAAVMGIFNEEHFSPKVALKGTNIDPLAGRPTDGEEGLQSTKATTSSLDHACLSFVGNTSSPRNGDKTANNASLALPQWVVLDGNVPQRTLEMVCRAVTLKNDSSRTEGEEDANKKNEGGSKMRRNNRKIRIALDPISKEKVLRSINVLDCIDLMKPNEYEVIALATALACKAESAEASQHRFIRPEMEVTNTTTTTTEQKKEEKKADNSIPTDTAHTLSPHLIGQTAESLRVALRGWQRRHNDKKGTSSDASEIEMMGETTDGRKGEFGQASVPKRHTILQKDLECDETFRGIVRMCLAASRRSNTKRSAADSGNYRQTDATDEQIHIQQGAIRLQLSTLIADSSHVLWEVYGRLTKSERDTLALVAACYVVCVGRVGHVLCTLGEGGCWSVRREGSFAFAFSTKGRREAEEDRVDEGEELIVMIRRIRSIPIPTTKLVKVTGAGDSFLSGYLYGLTVGAPAVAMPVKEGTTQSSKHREVNNLEEEAEAFAERCASLAAASALVSAQSTINPNIQQFVLGKEYAKHLFGEQSATPQATLQSKL